MIEERNNNRLEFAGYFNNRQFKLVKRIDKFLSFIYLSCQRQKSGRSPLTIYKNILIFESHLIGDIIMGLPAYRAIRKSFPETRLIFWGNFWGKDLLHGQNLFDQFFTAHIPWATYNYSPSNLYRLFVQIKELRKLKVDLALDFRGDIRNIFLLYLTGARRRVSYDFTGGEYWLTDIVSPPESCHVIDRNLNAAKFIGARIECTLPALRISPDKDDSARQYFKKMGFKKTVTLHPGASQKKKLWPAERFAQVVDFLKSKGYTPVLLCGPKDKIIVEQIREKCKSVPPVLSMPLKDLPAFINCSEFFIGNDSGITHIAAALGKSTITLFGPQPPSLTEVRNNGKAFIIFKDGFECRPCFFPECRYGNACMNAIEVNDVKDVIEKIEK